MGISNVKLVIVRWHDLGHVAFRALIYMAVRSMDSDDPPIYRAGWEELGLAIGRLIPDEDQDDKTTVRVRRNAEVAVNGATRELLKRGAITIRKRAGPGHNTVYALNLNDRTVQAQPEASGTSTVQAQPEALNPSGDLHEDLSEPERFKPSLPNGSSPAFQRFKPSLPTVQAQPEAKEYEEEFRKEERIDREDLRADLAVTRARDADDQPQDSAEEDSDREPAPDAIALIDSPQQVEPTPQSTPTPKPLTTAAQRVIDESQRRMAKRRAANQGGG